jgi:hypothetical protein
MRITQFIQGIIGWVHSAQPLARPSWCKTVMFSCQARSYSQAQEWQDSHRSQTWWEGGVQTSVSCWGAAVWGTCEHEMCCSPWLPILYPLNQTSSNLTWFTQTMETKHHPYMQRTKSCWPGLATKTGSTASQWINHAHNFKEAAKWINSCQP